MTDQPRPPLSADEVDQHLESFMMRHLEDFQSLAGQQPRPPLWRDMDDSYGIHTSVQDSYAQMIRAFATYLETHGLINTTGCVIPRSGPYLLEVLEEEARRAGAGE